MFAARLRLGYHDEQDAAQEARIAVWQAEQKGHSDSTYLRVVAKHAALNPVRGRTFGNGRRGGNNGRPKTVSESQVGTATSIHYDTYPSDTKHVRDAVNALSPKQKEIVFERFWLDKPFQDISVESGRYKSWAFAEWSRRIKPKLTQMLSEG